MVQHHFNHLHILILNKLDLQQSELTGPFVLDKIWTTLKRSIINHYLDEIYQGYGLYCGNVYVVTDST